MGKPLIDVLFPRLAIERVQEEINRSRIELNRVPVAVFLADDVYAQLEEQACNACVPKLSGCEPFTGPISIAGIPVLRCSQLPTGHLCVSFSMEEL